MPLDNPDLTQFTTASPAIASFSYEDIATGHKFVNFELYQTTETGGIDYKITSSPTESVGTSVTFQANNNTTTTTYNFSSDTFKQQRTLKDTALALFTYIAYSQDATHGITTRMTITIQHYDGTTTTDLGSAVTADLSSTATASYLGGRYAMSIPITEQNFAVGDQLKVKIDIYWSAPNTGNRPITFYTDPENGDTSGITGLNSTFKINIPTKVEL